MSKRVLIVDDAYFMRTLIKKVLKEAGYEIVDEAKNGKEGITKYFELKPDFVTMDINMPDISGIEATRQILTKDPHAKIIAVTASIEDEIKTEMLSAGAKEYLRKPFQPAFLLSKIDDMFAGKELTVEEVAGVEDLNSGKPQAVTKTDLKEVKNDKSQTETDLKEVKSVEQQSEQEVEEDFFETMEFVLQDKPNQTRDELLVIKNNDDDIEFSDDDDVQNRDQYALVKDAPFEIETFVTTDQSPPQGSSAFDKPNGEVQVSSVTEEPIKEVFESIVVSSTDSTKMTPIVEFTETPSPNPPKEEVNSYMQIRPPRGRVLPQTNTDHNEKLDDLIEPVINDIDGGISMPSPKKGILSKLTSIFSKK